VQRRKERPFYGGEEKQIKEGKVTTLSKPPINPHKRRSLGKAQEKESERNGRKGKKGKDVTGKRGLGKRWGGKGKRKKRLGTNAEDFCKGTCSAGKKKRNLGSGLPPETQKVEKPEGIRNKRGEINRGTGGVSRPP